MDIFNDALDQIGVIYQQKRGVENEASLDPGNLYKFI